MFDVCWSKIKYEFVEFVQGLIRKNVENSKKNYSIGDSTTGIIYFFTALNLSF